MEFSDGAQSFGIIHRGHGGTAPFDLNEHQLQCIATFGASSRSAVVFAYRQQVHDANRLSATFSTKSHELPVRARRNAPNAYLRHCHSPSCGP